MDYPWRLNPAVVHTRFATGKRTAIICGNYDHGIFKNTLFLKLSSHQPNVIIKTADFMIVSRQVLTGNRCVDQVRRDNHILGVVLGCFFGNAPSTMCIGRGKPKEERFIFGAVLNMADPILFLPGSSTAGDSVEGSVLIPKHMILARENGVISGLTQ